MDAVLDDEERPLWVEDSEEGCPAGADACDDEDGVAGERTSLQILSPVVSHFEIGQYETCPVTGTPALERHVSLRHGEGRNCINVPLRTSRR